jgi:hypothetical protein
MNTVAMELLHEMHTVAMGLGIARNAHGCYGTIAGNAHGCYGTIAQNACKSHYAPDWSWMRFPWQPFASQPNV